MYDVEYHMAFCAKCSLGLLYENFTEICVEVIREICSINCMNTISENVGSDHVHMPVSVTLYLAVSKIVQYVKGEAIENYKRKKCWEAHV